MPEITDFATIVLLVAGGFALAVASTKLTERVPVPAPAIFLLAAAIVSDLWPSVYQAVDVHTVERIAVVALVVILFNGGIDIGWRRFRASAGPILSLGILGTFATAGLAAVIAHYALGFEWILAGIVGAAIAPTDPAVVFSVLGRREVRGRSGTTLEGEAGVNDPAGIALMLGMVELATHADASFWVVVREFAVEMSIGVALGLLGALVLLRCFAVFGFRARGCTRCWRLFSPERSTQRRRSPMVRASSPSSSQACSSGMPACRTRARSSVSRASLASLAELVVFVALGLTIDIGGLSGRVWLEGIVLALVLALLVRPLIVL